MKKGQMSAFLIVGFVMFLLVGIIFAAVFMSSRSEYQRKADSVAEALMDSKAVRTYIDNCVAQVSKDTFQELMLSGGFFPDLVANMSGRSVAFMDFRDRTDLKQKKTAYLIYRGADDIDPNYPCPLFGNECGGPGTRYTDDGVHFCNFSFSDDQVQSCTFGDTAPLIMDLTEYSLKKQLEKKVAENMDQCINMSFFAQYAGYEFSDLSQGKVDADVTFGDTAVTFDVEIPLVIHLSEAESIRSSTSSYVLDTDFRRLYSTLFSGTRSVLHQEKTDLDSNMDAYMEEQLLLNNLDYTVEKRPNEFAKDDLYILEHDYFTINGYPFRFVFAVGNRMPVLDLIDYSKRTDCEIAVTSGTEVVIEPEAKDPDEGDNITISYVVLEDGGMDSWSFSDGVARKTVSASDKISGDMVSRLRVIASDGLLNDSQEVRVCVDDSMDLIYSPTVSLYHPYEGFELKEYNDTLDDQVPIISLEDPIRLKMGSGFSGKGEWQIGKCIQWVESNCVIFPGFQACDPDNVPDIADVKNSMIDCLSPGNQMIRFHPDEGNGAIDIPVKVVECLPHKDQSGSAGDNKYLKTHVCCQESFTYQPAGTPADSRKELICGLPSSSSVWENASNDVIQKQFTAVCTGMRGNLYDEKGGFTNEATLVIEDAVGSEVRRCLGCGIFGETTINVTRKYDYEKRDRFEDTFESSYYQDNDPAASPYLCNEEYACVSSLDPSPRGRYDPTNLVSSHHTSGPLKCRAACNYGLCDYAVDCVCTDECGEDVGACNGREPGSFAGTCGEAPLGEPYFPDVCDSYCGISDIQENITFRCDGALTGTDCTACDLACDKKKPGERLEVCNSEGTNTAVLDMCDNKGNVIDQERNGRMMCAHDKDASCTSSIECDGNYIGEFRRSLSGKVVTTAGSPLYADTCNENCMPDDSDTCWKTDENDVETICHERVVGEGFDRIGSPKPDAFCSGKCEYYSCGHFAYKGGARCLADPTIENCCYDSDDKEPLSEKCNVPNPDPERDDCIPLQ
ncbi:MAG: hypothetical protein ACOC32_02590 [Nanoarchaeota archaeon]